MVTLHVCIDYGSPINEQSAEYIHVTAPTLAEALLHAAEEATQKRDYEPNDEVVRSIWSGRAWTDKELAQAGQGPDDPPARFAPDTFYIFTTL